MSMSDRFHCQADVGGVIVGDDQPVVIVGALNVSPESFYAGSVHVGADDILRSAEAMLEAGAAIIDVGGMSTAPYLETTVSEAEERDRLATAVEVIASKLPVVVSADTARPAPAEAAVEAGARILNDVSGLSDARVGRLAAARGVSVILMPRRARSRNMTGEEIETPMRVVMRGLEQSLAAAHAVGIADERIVLDPGIGFFLSEPEARARWDIMVLAQLDRLRALGRPLCVAVSRKSFIGTITGRRAPAERLAGSLAATTVAVLNGAAMIRTHDVPETRDAIRIAERLRAAGSC